MTVTSAEVAAIVLAGGQARRFGGDKLAADVKSVLSVPETRQTLVEQGAVPRGTGPAEGGATVVRIARRILSVVLFTLELPIRATRPPTATPPRMNSGRIAIASTASLTSRASIFLPTYSGVRPTISPATNTARIANSRKP